MKDFKIIVYDIETTGFLQQGGKIVEVGIVELDLSNGKTKTLFDKVMHERPITESEVKNSWIVSNGFMTLEEIRKSKQLSFYKEEIQSIFDKYENGLTAYNRKFDNDFMISRGFELKKMLPCPMLLSTDVCKIENSYRGGYKWPKAQEAYDHFFGKTDYIEAHRGADDAIHEAKIVFELYKKGIFKID